MVSVPQLQVDVEKQEPTSGLCDALGRFRHLAHGLDAVKRDAIVRRLRCRAGLACWCGTTADDFLKGEEAPIENLVLEVLLG